MPSLPTGTVTLLFSDIEGSTALLARLGSQYVQALDGQREILRNAWAAHDGTELGTEGDSFYVAFATAPAALAAAVQAQQELSAFDWPGGEPVKIRMGIHTGSPTPHDGAYVGMDVHRAARIAAAAHGGQVVLSEASAGLVRGELAEGVALRDLGAHRLKDLPQPERVFQVVTNGLPAEFPPLKSVGAVTSLPVPATPLVGREEELAELTQLLASPEVRLVTLTGPGGSGKTRLAIGLAERLVGSFPDGVYFVDLSSTTSVEVMWSTIADAAAAPPSGRIPPGVLDHMAHQRALFVLDNLEQIPDADLACAELLQRAPQLKVVATSRRLLLVPGERIHPVPPLGLGETGALKDAQTSSAVEMFVHHGQMAHQTFALTPENVADIVAVCRRLEGLPLAIELAAARLRLLSLRALLARLDQSLDIAAATRLTPSRQRTMRDTIAWSYRLLDEGQQQLFRALSVFVGGADLNAVEKVCGGTDPLEAVASLADASLLTVSETADGEPRVSSLATVRTYAQDQLTANADEERKVRGAHAHHFLSLARELWTNREGSADRELAARRRFEQEHGNFRAVLDWALSEGDNRSTRERWTVAADLCRYLAWCWYAEGHLDEGRSWLERLVDLPLKAKDTRTFDCLRLLGTFALWTGDYSVARRRLVEANEGLRRLGDDELALTTTDVLAVMESELGHEEAARRLLEEAIASARAMGSDVQVLPRLLTNLGNEVLLAGEFKFAVELYAEAQQIHARRGNEVGALWAKERMVGALRSMGRLEEAMDHALVTLPAIIRVAPLAELFAAAEEFSLVAALLGHPTSAVALLGAVEAERERSRFARDPIAEAEMQNTFRPVQEAMGSAAWRQHHERGQDMTIEDAAHRVLAEVTAGRSAN